MNSRFTEIKEILGKPYMDLEFMLECLADVLEGNGETELASQIPWLSGTSPDFSGSNRHKLLRLYSIAFQLLNLSEVNGAVQGRRRKHDDKGLASVNGLWGSVLSDLKELGVDQHKILEQFRYIEAEPVLTAHPTEAKRPVVLTLYRQLYL